MKLQLKKPINKNNKDINPSISTNNVFHSETVNSCFGL